MNNKKNIHSVNSLYFIIGQVDEHIAERNENKYLMFADTDKDKEVVTKYTKIWDKIRILIKKISDKPGDYGKNFIKIKLNVSAKAS